MNLSQGDGTEEVTAAVRIRHLRPRRSHRRTSRWQRTTEDSRPAGRRVCPAVELPGNENGGLTFGKRSAEVICSSFQQSMGPDSQTFFRGKLGQDSDKFDVSLKRQTLTQQLDQCHQEIRNLSDRNVELGLEVTD